MLDQNNQIVVLIPAFNPSEKILKLVRDLSESMIANIVVVNDGSKKEFQCNFDKLKSINKCIVIEHAVNLGKGRSLKTGLNYIYSKFNYAIGVVTADADGQHIAHDILKVADELCEHSASLILGVREFKRDVPLRSLFGNIVTKFVFHFFAGLKISDTQSGLRGIPRSIIPQLLPLYGEGYNYETNMLLSTRDIGIKIIEVPIQTIYLDNNESSHFYPILDSIRIYYIFIKYSASSISASIVDFIIFSLVYYSTYNITASIFIARLVSSLINFMVNKTYVFSIKGNSGITLLKYYLLLLVSATTALLVIKNLLLPIGINIIVAKILTETLLFFMNYQLQRSIVFTKK
ncbi:MAG: glycosyltransferase [Ignavibacteriales bacterium]|nr:glycosyltransferase [Ignavibacteriales bacterium]